jgi:hypothetical protein
MIDRNQALAVARDEVERQGLWWVEPVIVHFGIWNYRIWTNANSRGGNVAIRVNRRSGQVTALTTTPR